VQLGALPLSGSGWQLQTTINTQTGQIGIDLFSTTPMQTTSGGTLVTIALHARDNAPLGSTGINLVPSVNPTGSRSFVTTVSDAQGGMVLHTAETALGMMPGVPGEVTVGTDPFLVGQFMARSPTDQSSVTSGQLAVNNKDESPSSTAHSPLTTALAQVFGDMEPLMMAQESAMGQPGVILGSPVEDQTGTNLSDTIMQKIGVAQHDWVPDDMVAYLGQAAKAGRRLLDGDLSDAGLSGQDAGDLAGVEEFFAAVAAGRNGRS
jgi:hypothetical protein